MKRLIKLSLKSVGLNISKVQGWQDNFTWLQRNNIKTVLDIGANTGQFAKLIHEVLPKAKIYSFEPIPSVYELLKKNTANQDLPVTCMPYALGAEDGEMEMNVNDFSPSSSMLDITDIHKKNFKFAQKTRKENITIRKLDGIPSLDIVDNLFIKIDVQGFEDQVIKGGLSTIAKAKIILCEVTFKPLYENQKLFGDIYKEFIALGFRYEGNFEQVYDNTTGEILYADAIFVNYN